MRINHNIAALNTHRQLNSASTAQSKSMEKLASGLRINKAGDDAAGLAISEKMRGQIRGLEQAGRNAQDSISMIQTAEGALNETHDILQRMRELAVQAGNDTNTGTDRGEIQKELNQLTSEVNRIGNTTEFNSQKLLNASDGVVTTGSPAVPGTPAGTDTPATHASGEIASSGITISAAAGGDYAGAAGEGLNVVISASSGATVGAEVSSGTLTITLDADNIMDEGAINAALAAGSLDSDFTLSGTGTVSDTDAGTLSGGADLIPGAPATPGTPASGAKSSFSTQIGANENQTMTLEFEDMRAAALGLTGTGTGFTGSATVTDGTNNTANENALDVSNATNAGNAVTAIQSAIEKVSAERSKLGANQNRLEHTINNLNTSSENLTSAESRVRDVDYALAA